MSSGARNCPFLMFTGRPAAATAWMKSVCRHRKAGVCSTSTTDATSGTSAASCTSVSTGTPTWRLTSARMRRPSAMPGPRNDAAELRFALSYDDLKMNGMPVPAQISLSLPATSTLRSRDSTTQGPAIRKSGRSSPTSKPHSFIERGASERSERGGRSSSDATSSATASLALPSFARRWRSCAARTKPMNSGWPRRGLEVNSGWNWQPKNHGCDPNSIISQRSPAVSLRARAPTTRPAASRRGR